MAVDKLEYYGFESYEFETIHMNPKNNSVYIHDLEGRLFYWLKICQFRPDTDETNGEYALVFLPSGVVTEKLLNNKKYASIDNLIYVVQSETAHDFITVSGHRVRASIQDVENSFFIPTIDELIAYKKEFSSPTKYHSQQRHFISCALRRMKKIF